MKGRYDNKHKMMLAANFFGVRLLFVKHNDGLFVQKGSHQERIRCVVEGLRTNAENNLKEFFCALIDELHQYIQVPPGS